MQNINGSIENLFHADCLNILDNIQSESVDLVIADPPYFEIINEAWDHQWAGEQAYLEWCKNWTEQCIRILKPGGSLYIWGTTKTNTFLKYKMEILDQISNIHYENWIIWAYDWGGRTKKTFPRKHEDLLGYSKLGAQKKWYPQQIEVERKVKMNIRTGKPHANGKIPTDLWESDIWKMNNHTCSKEFCNWHPTQKPIDLLQRIILAHTKENDKIFIPFLGSGNDAIAAIRLNRNVIGTEKSSEYYQKMIERIKLLSQS